MPLPTDQVVSGSIPGTTVGIFFSGEIHMVSKDLILMSFVLVLSSGQRPLHSADHMSRGPVNSVHVPM